MGSKDISQNVDRYNRYNRHGVLKEAGLLQRGHTIGIYVYIIV